MDKILLAMLPTKAMLPAVLQEQKNLSEKIELDISYYEQINYSVNWGFDTEYDPDCTSVYSTSDFGYAEVQQTSQNYPQSFFSKTPKS